MAKSRKNAKKVSFEEKYGFEFNRTEYMEAAKELKVWAVYDGGNPDDPEDGYVMATVDKSLPKSKQVVAHRDENRRKVYELMAEKHEGAKPKTATAKGKKAKTDTAKKSEPAKQETGDFRSRLMALVTEYEAMGFGKDAAMQAALAEINAK